MGNDRPKGLTLRGAVAADRPALERLANQTVAEHVARLPDTFVPAAAARE